MFIMSEPENIQSSYFYDCVIYPFALYPKANHSYFISYHHKILFTPLKKMKQKINEGVALDFQRRLVFLILLFKKRQSGDFVAAPLCNSYPCFPIILARHRRRCHHLLAIKQGGSRPGSVHLARRTDHGVCSTRLSLFAQRKPGFPRSSPPILIRPPSVSICGAQPFS